MRVFTSKFSGFCPGVFQAEKKIFEALAARPKKTLYVLGYLIHNQTYIDYLAERSVVTLEKPEEAPDGELIVIRTHGLQKEIEEQLRKNHPILDLTCPKVKKVQLEIGKYADQGYFVVITGKRNHPEVQGLLSYAYSSTVVEKDEDLRSFVASFPASGIKKVLIISQTTGERDLFETTCRELRAAAERSGALVEIHDSICSITSLREKDSLQIQARVDVTFVIGDRMSSNASKLFKILAEQNPSTYFVNSREELKALALPFGRWKTAQVVSSSSTPAFVEKEIVDFLEAL